jgi:hypothetical protein
MLRERVVLSRFLLSKRNCTLCRFIARLVDQLLVVQTARIVAYPWESPPIGDWEIPGRQLRLRPHHRDLCGLIHPQIGPDRSPMPSAGATTCR